MSAAVCIARITDVASVDAVDPLLEAYVTWAAGEVVQQLGLPDDVQDRLVAEHQQRFRDEIPTFVGPAGRLLVARVGDALVGLVGMVPVEPGVCEVKRMYVDPAARGLGVGRALLVELLAGARAAGYRTARLETMDFMVEALALYRSLGFEPAPPPSSSESARSGVDAGVHFLALDLTIGP